MGLGASLFDHHVFVDLETTGLDPALDRVIELGALFVHHGQVTRRVTRLFDPGREIPQEVQALTGIQPADVAGQPTFDSLRTELRGLFAGWTVVAHNAEFERGFFAGILEEIGASVLDSCELLHYLHPELPSHSLDALVRWAHVGDRARHRALPDCEDTFAVVQYALEGCIHQGRLADVVDLLDCLASSASPGAQPPLVELLTSVAALCLAHQEADGCGAGKPGSNALGYEERAPYAYVRAYLRRGGDVNLRGLSSWFKRRFPATRELESKPQAETTTASG